MFFLFKYISIHKNFSYLSFNLLFIYFFPKSSLIIYILTYLYKKFNYITIFKRNLWKKFVGLTNKKKYKLINLKNKNCNKIFKFCEFSQMNKSYSCKSKLFSNTTKIINSIIKDIKSSNKNIYMTFYIFQVEGKTLNLVKELIKASKRGVSCKIILDHIGCWNFFNSKYFNYLKKVGVKIVKAMRINSIFNRIDIRQHRKMILIDNKIAYVGSMNIIDPTFFKRNKKIGKWTDIMLKVKGPIVLYLNFIFYYDWAVETESTKIVNKIKFLNFKKNYYKKNSPKNIIQSVVSGNNLEKNFMHELLLLSIYSAKRRLVIITPYFVPSSELLNAICNVSKSGIKVIIIVPIKNDFILIEWISKPLFEALLKSGVSIYRYKKGLLHTKSIIIDENISFIGTINFDCRSIKINLEITLIIDDKKFNKKLTKISENYIKFSEEENIKNYLNKSSFIKILEKLLFCLFNYIL